MLCRWSVRRNFYGRFHRRVSLQSPRPRALAACVERGPTRKLAAIVSSHSRRRAVSIVERAKNICLSPATEWPVIAAEPTTTGALISGYVVPLAAIGAVAGFLGGSIIGQTLPFLGTYRSSLATGLVVALFTFCMAIVCVFRGVARDQRARADLWRRTKQHPGAEGGGLFVHARVDCWRAADRPAAWHLRHFAALYGLYLLFLGLPRLMKCPEDKALGYTAVVVVCAIVLSVIISSIGASDCRRGHDRRRRARRHGRAALQRRDSIRQEQHDGQAAGLRKETRGEQQEDGGRAEERRPERDGGRGDGEPWDAARRRQACRSGGHRPAQGVRAGESRRPCENGKQRGKERDRRLDGVQSGSEIRQMAPARP